MPFTKQDDNLGSADIHTIKRMIPHRYPVLLIDKVINIDIGKSCVGIKNVTANEPHFEGHFPSKPVMPGVLIVESMAQAAAVLVIETIEAVDNELLVYLCLSMSVSSARWWNPVISLSYIYLLFATVVQFGNFAAKRGSKVNLRQKPNFLQ